MVTTTPSERMSTTPISLTPITKNNHTKNNNNTNTVPVTNTGAFSMECASPLIFVRRVSREDLGYDDFDGDDDSSRSTNTTRIIRQRHLKRRQVREDHVSSRAAIEMAANHLTTRDRNDNNNHKQLQHCDHWDRRHQQRQEGLSLSLSHRFTIWDYDIDFLRNAKRFIALPYNASRSPPTHSSQTCNSDNHLDLYFIGRSFGYNHKDDGDSVSSISDSDISDDDDDDDSNRSYEADIDINANNQCNEKNCNRDQLLKIEKSTGWEFLNEYEDGALSPRLS
mmetsp:Transcript_13867/g.17498  ORF Transcript_13867/g.17498 Transcript_13867/m.17498 type:complete len:280 (+) Transcript_13867:66-905(+)|eukprot:CAMPEP_0203699948 /NCGR_PEP_ID=MMETSP0091-20130426/29072_1 /ASSEMBLY_ACC=CAM_ASM_001089 /TAXON_ID=426623 /ORGANISM="Chaetoceros affinis, Strain CCMP159" /LENGTH=279 /DNA_ID=CAMNT_0050572995 /DNA_START=50 /DNA_END=889 /DNA_ORIENTATION=-